MPTRLTRRRLIALTGTAALTGIAGCASGSASEDTTTTTDHHDDGHGGDHTAIPSDPTDHAEVSMVSGDHGHHFEPHVAWVTPGGTVTWVNESGSHTTTAYHPENSDHPRRIPAAAEPWDSGLLTAAGATYEHTFPEPGVYDYFCAPHETMGMLGTVVVGTPDPHDQPGLAKPSDSLNGTVRSKLTELNGMVDEMLGHHHE
ncbi:MAG: plastocyanin/azurin family copper-binding protein [Halobacteriaceae archaeon]